MPSDATIREYKEQLNDDDEIEATFQQMRRDGHSRKEAVQILLKVLGCSLTEAKQLLATSTTWDEAFDQRDDTSSSSPSVPPAPG